jgi:hypothetical protein
VQAYTLIIFNGFSRVFRQAGSQVFAHARAGVLFVAEVAGALGGLGVHAIDSFEILSV